MSKKQITSTTSAEANGVSREWVEQLIGDQVKKRMTEGTTLSAAAGPAGEGVEQGAGPAGQGVEQDAATQAKIATMADDLIAAATQDLQSRTELLSQNGFLTWWKNSIDSIFPGGGGSDAAVEGSLEQKVTAMQDGRRKPRPHHPRGPHVANMEQTQDATPVAEAAQDAKLTAVSDAEADGKKKPRPHHPRGPHVANMEQTQDATPVAEAAQDAKLTAVSDAEADGKKKPRPHHPRGPHVANMEQKNNAIPSEVNAAHETEVAQDTKATAVHEEEQFHWPWWNPAPKLAAVAETDTNKQQFIYGGMELPGLDLSTGRRLEQQAPVLLAGGERTNPFASSVDQAGVLAGGAMFLVAGIALLAWKRVLKKPAVSANDIPDEFEYALLA